MINKEIQAQLLKKHNEFIKYISGLSDDDFLFCLSGKWSAGQQVDHIYRSVKPLLMALKLPVWAIKWWIGRANRPSKSYDQLVAKYKHKLSEGGKAFGRFIPEEVNPKNRETICRELHALVNKLVFRMGKYSESELDSIILPHPLLGKITLREMMYFTIYHAEHHMKLAEKTLIEKNRS